MSDRYVPVAGHGRVTPFYDAVNAVTMRQGLWRPRLIERALRPPAPTRILDLGCGTGAMSLAIGHEHPNVTLIGIDGDPRVLERTRTKALSPGIKLELNEALADRIPLPNASVDCVISTLVFHHLSPTVKREALAEAHRVLTPNGRLLICDAGRASDPIMRAMFFAVQLLDGFPTTRENAQGKLPDLISQAGFSAVEVFARCRTGGGTLELIEALR